MKAVDHACEVVGDRADPFTDTLATQALRRCGALPCTVADPDALDARLDASSRDG